MVRTFYRFITRVLVVTFDGGELALSVVTRSSRFSDILRAVALAAPAGYRYAETIA